MIYAGTSHLPWKTSDNGKTWESIHSGMIDDSDVFSIYIDPRSPKQVFASACSGIYQSPNGGEMWRKMMGIPNTPAVRMLSARTLNNPVRFMQERLWAYSSQ